MYISYTRLYTFISLFLSHKWYHTMLYNLHFFWIHFGHSFILAYDDRSSVVRYHFFHNMYMVTVIRWYVSWGKKALICNVCEIPWCKYFHHDWFCFQLCNNWLENFLKIGCTPLHSQDAYPCSRTFLISFSFDFTKKKYIKLFNDK